MSQGQTSVGAKVDEDVKRRFRVKAAMEDKTMSQYIGELIEQEVEDTEIPG